jgi:hypothetical protein
MDPLLRTLDAIRSREYDLMEPPIDDESDITAEDIEDARAYYAEQRFDAGRDG